MIAKTIIILFILILIVLPLISASPFIVGIVNNASDGTNSNSHIAFLWNPTNGESDNLTDIIGPNGNSGADNIYMIDCGLLTTPCAVGDEIRVKVVNNGSNYITDYVNTTITGSGFETMSNLTLNSPPNITLNFPINYANFSSIQQTFMCTANDLDANLANSTLYGNWSGGWHANETKISTGSTNTTNFTINLDEGRYIWACLATDNLSISSFSPVNYTFTLDNSPPIISSVVLNATGPICGINNQIRVNCTTNDSLSRVESVIIESFSPLGIFNQTAQLLSGDTYYSDILLNETGSWKFNCLAKDFSGNSANLTSNEIGVHPTNPDINISSDNMVFETNPLENQLIMINATIFNNGCTAANNFLVGFFKGDPDSNGTQLGQNQSISIEALGNNLTNISWNTEIGTTNFFVSADLNNSIPEENETNNKANKTIMVNAWQDFFGNVSVSKLIGDVNIKNLSIWYNESFLTGNIFITDKESNIKWNSLQAIHKNTTGANTTNDFSDIDAIINMASLDDSISNKFTSDGNSPISISNFIIRQQSIQEVPIINSTNTTNFITGILWDTSDDSSLNAEYDTTDKEDLIFVTKVNKTSQGAYGIYDYEITIPARIREYNTVDTSEVFIYFDLN